MIDVSLLWLVGDRRRSLPREPRQSRWLPMGDGWVGGGRHACRPRVISLLRSSDDQARDLSYPTSVHLLVGHDDPQRPFLGVEPLTVALVHEHNDLVRVRRI